MERLRQARRRRREYETTWTVLDEQMMQRARDLAREPTSVVITDVTTGRCRLHELLDWARTTPASDPSFRTAGLIGAAGAALAVLGGVIGWAAIVSTNPVALATVTIVALLAAGVTFGVLHRWLQP